MLGPESLFSTSPRVLRQFAATSLVVFGLFAALRWRQAGFDSLTALGLGLAVLIGLGGLLWPQAIRLVYLACALVTFPLGWCLGWILIAVIFLGVFTPLGLCFRLLGRDALRLRHRPDAATYWTPRQQPLEGRDYFRQY